MDEVRPMSSVFWGDNVVMTTKYSWVRMLDGLVAGVILSQKNLKMGCKNITQTYPVAETSHTTSLTDKNWLQKL